MPLSQYPYLPEIIQANETIHSSSQSELHLIEVWLALSDTSQSAKDNNTSNQNGTADRHSTRLAFYNYHKNTSQDNGKKYDDTKLYLQILCLLMGDIVQQLDYVD